MGDVLTDSAERFWSVYAYDGSFQTVSESNTTMRIGMKGGMDPREIVSDIARSLKWSCVEIVAPGDAPVRPALIRVSATARLRAQGALTTIAVRDAWRDVRGVADAVAWLARVETHGGDPIDGGTDADAATECARLLETVRVSLPRGRLVVPLLEYSDAAVRALGGTLAVKVNV